MNLYDRLKNKDLSEAEEDEIFGSLIRRYEEDQLKLRWASILERKYGVVRPKEDPAIIPIARSKWLWWGIIAACLTGLLFVGINLWLQPNGEQLVAAQIDQVQLISLRSMALPQEDLDKVRNEFTDAFQVQNWEKAIALSDQLLANDFVPSDDLLHSAFVNLQLGRYGEAEKLLEELLARNDILRVEAQFYLGVAQLAAGKIDAGTATLKKIGPEAGEKYHQRAEKLLSIRY